MIVYPAFFNNKQKLKIMKTLVKFIDAVSSFLYGNKSVCDKSFKMF